MEKEETRQRLSDGTSEEHDAIVRALHVLEAALASPATGREDAWTKRVAQDLAPVVAAVEDHCRAAEAPDGLVRECELALGGRPRALTTVSQEHRRLPAEAQELLRSLEESPDIADVRRRAADLAAKLRAHQAHEADLIFEALLRDIGVGD